MAVTFAISNVRVFAEGDHKKVIATVTATGTATSTGDALTRNALGFTDGILDFVSCEFSPAGFQPVYDHTNQKMRFFTAPAAPGATVAMVEAVGATVTGAFRVTLEGFGGPASGPAK
jgi:hypothetical protein